MYQQDAISVIFFFQYLVVVNVTLKSDRKKGHELWMIKCLEVEKLGKITFSFFPFSSTSQTDSTNMHVQGW